MLLSEIPYIIGTSPNDAVMTSWFVLVGKSAHVPDQLSESSHSEMPKQML